MTAEQWNWPFECNHAADVAVSGNEFDTLSLQLTSRFVSVQRVKLAAHDHQQKTKTTTSAEKQISVQQLVLHLFSVIDKSLTVVPCLRRYSTKRFVALWFRHD